jgi:hypothetical protein
MLIYTNFNIYANNNSKDNIILITYNYNNKKIIELDNKLLNENNISIEETDCFVNEQKAINYVDENYYGIDVDFMYNKNLTQSISKLISRGTSVYVYGKDLDIEKLEESLNIEINSKGHKKEFLSEKEEKNNVLENKWDIVGFVNGKINYFGSINSFDYNNKKKELKLENYIEVLVDNKDRFKLKKSLLMQKGIGEGNNLVDSLYDLNDYLYRDDAWGHSILRAQLNADYDLYQNISEDSNPDYDYFFIENNVELTFNKEKSALGKSVEATHTLIYPTDEIRGWGPSTTNDTDSFSVGLPWSASWTFSANQKIDITTTGSQKDDTVHFKGHNYHFPYGDYTFEGETARIKPGTAWASRGSSLAAISLKDTAKVEYAATMYTLSISKNIKYSY